METEAKEQPKTEAGASPAQAAPPAEKKLETEQPKPSQQRKPMSNPNPKKPNQPPPRDRRPSKESVIARARQMNRQQMRKIWTALGFEGEFDEAKFDENLSAHTKAAGDGKGAVEQSNARIRQLESENSQLKQKLQKAQQAQTAAERKAAELESSLEDYQAEQEIRDAAKENGFVDLDYGIELFRRHVNGLPEGQEPDVKSFFGDLKKDAKMKHFFSAEDVQAGPRSAADTGTTTTQQPPPAGQQAAGAGGQGGGNNNPPPKPNVGGKEEPVDATTMSKADFAKHASAKYDYRAGMS